MSKVITLENVRITFPQLHVPQTVNGQGEPAFSAGFIMTPNSPAHKLIEATILEVGLAHWKDAWKVGKGKMPDGSPTPGLYSVLKSTGKLCLHSGDEKPDYEGYAGNFTVSARNKTRPGVIDRDTSPITAADDKCKSGDYVRTSLEIWAMDNEYGKRVCAKLRWVQFIGLGDRFAGGGSPVSPDEYEDISQTADATADVGGGYA